MHFNVLNVFKSTWHKEAKLEIMCLRMASYPVTWNIMSLTYAEEKLSEGKQDGNVPSQAIIEINGENVKSNFISRQCFTIYIYPF